MLIPKNKKYKSFFFRAFCFPLNQMNQTVLFVLLAILLTAVSRVESTRSACQVCASLEIVGFGTTASELWVCAARYLRQVQRGQTPAFGSSGWSDNQFNQDYYCHCNGEKRYGIWSIPDNGPCATCNIQFLLFTCSQAATWDECMFVSFAFSLFLLSSSSC